MKLSPNEVKEEFSRVAKNSYQSFIKRMKLKNLRGFKDQVIDLEYPVTALIGTNGGGKSTILGAAGIAYGSVKPGQFFPKASVEYELVDKNKSPEKLVARSARFKEARWRRDDPPARHVEYIEIQRTVPAGEVSRFKRFISESSEKIALNKLSAETIKYASAILDRDISAYRVASVGGATMYVGAFNGSEYSQFHFGAGEASVIATVDRIESAPDNSLVLIEELENGLHPVAVRAMVDYLQNVARRKRHQVIFTTHSQDAINRLPAEAIWASINKRVWQGKLSIESLRAISGDVPDARVIFVEDEFVQNWVTSAIGHHRSKLAADTKVYMAGGYPAAVQVCRYHNENPHVKVPAVALLDGDIYKPDGGVNLPPFAMILGKEIPETQVFQYIYENRDELSGVIRQRCLLSAHSQGAIVAAIEAVRNSAVDPHTYFDEVGDRLDYSSGLKIRDGMVDIYNEKHAEFWAPVMDFIEERTALP